MFNFKIINNNCPEAVKYTEIIKKILIDEKWNEDDSKPDFVFVLGGDGTFINAFNKYNNGTPTYVPFKMGSIGFFTNYNNIKDFKKILNIINSKNGKIKELEIVECIFDNVTKYALNEIKVINNLIPLKADLFINDNFFQKIHGSGIVVSTSSGSTGYIKSVGGAVIFSDSSEIYQLKEIASVSNSNFHSLNAGLILNKNDTIELKNIEILENITFDTFSYQANKIKSIKIKLSDLKAKVLFTQAESRNKILNSIFSK